MLLFDDLFDDPVTPPSAPAHAAAIRHEISRIYELIQPEFARGGAYRNRFGELVTWDASADGSYCTMQTWPGE